MVSKIEIFDANNLEWNIHKILNPAEDESFLAKTSENSMLTITVECSQDNRHTIITKTPLKERKGENGETTGFTSIPYLATDIELKKGQTYMLTVKLAESSIGRLLKITHQ